MHNIIMNNLQPERCETRKDEILYIIIIIFIMVSDTFFVFPHFTPPVHSHLATSLYFCTYVAMVSISYMFVNIIISHII